MQNAFLFFSLMMISQLSFAQLEFIEKKSATIDACNEFIKTIETNYHYGWVNVPTNYDQPQASQSRVFYYYKKDSTLKNPVIFFNGGPGFSSQSSSVMLDQSLQKFEMTKKIDLIYIDQRGTGCSTPQFPLGDAPETLDNLRWYASLGIVKDAEAVRKTLIGDRKWKIFGQSYGAYIVYRYIETHPEGVSKAFAHGNAMGVSDFNGSYYRIASQQKVLEKFFKLFPDMKTKLKILKQELTDKTLCFKAANDQDTCGYEILSHFVYSLGFRDQWKFLAVYLKNIVPGPTLDKAYLANYVSQNIQQPFVYRDVSNPEKYAATTNFFYNFAGLYDWDTTPLDAQKCLLIFDKMKTSLKITTDQMLLNECLAPVQFDYKDLMKPYLAPKIAGFGTRFVQPEVVLKNITQFKIPVFSYSGSLDCFISKDFFATQIKAAGKKITHRHFEDSGHEGFATERQVFTDLMN